MVDGPPVQRPYGFVQRWLRIAAAGSTFGATATFYVFLALFLVPFRGVRLRLAGRYARWIAPIMLRIAGITIEVAGAEHSRDATPAIFVMNHPSSLDAAICMYVWPVGACGIGKREILLVPFFGVAFVAAGMPLIDRSDHDQAVAALDRLARVVRKHRMSPWLAPEGTRSADGVLGPFKKGFVHLALATGLNIVPVVVHGAQHCLPARTFRLTRGHVRVEFLPPIDTSAWTAEAVDDHVRETHAVFAAALADEAPLVG